MADVFSANESGGSAGVPASYVSGDYISGIDTQMIDGRGIVVPWGGGQLVRRFTSLDTVLQTSQKAEPILMTPTGDIVNPQLETLLSPGTGSGIQQVEDTTGLGALTSLLGGGVGAAGVAGAVGAAGPAGARGGMGGVYIIYMTPPGGGTGPTNFDDISAGDGIVITGTSTAIVIAVNPGAGLEFDDDDYLQADLGNGLEFGTDGSDIQADLGNGLEFSGSDIQADLGDGLEFSGSDIQVKIGDGLKIVGTTLQLDVDTDQFTFTGGGSLQSKLDEC